MNVIKLLKLLNDGIESNRRVVVGLQDEMLTLNVVGDENIPWATTAIERDVYQHELDKEGGLEKLLKPHIAVLNRHAP